MYHAIFVRSHYKWSFDSGDWSRPVANAFFKHEKTISGEKNVRLISIDSDKPEDINRVIHCLNTGISV